MSKMKRDLSERVSEIFEYMFPDGADHLSENETHMWMTVAYEFVIKQDKDKARSFNDLSTDGS